MPLATIANDFQIERENHTICSSDEEYDVIIYAGENESVKEIYAYSLIIRTRSQYFRTEFSKKWPEKKDGKFIFKKPNIPPQLFIISLRFIYCGKIDLTNLLGFEHESFTEFWNVYLDRICEEPLMLFNSDKFIKLNALLLEFLLNRDDLNLDEIIVWNNLIKWCLAQHSNIPQDVKKWNKEDVTL
ncbi:hypothetical protein GLOIN_2v1768572 [Rhizophagus irregularis DAOM 181602=DAOM 197198]|uniref:BTB domain-containing protein n=1 Tax=Rhizophagus irregularis (strain DAOM 181602 / DAOM 197198 / MUCL 43194) TaxID=747089 RepID=A0A2P4QGU1_RHIID|nr:hypothetical protein GLOIN_2v1768572 [Rhizophagus irregularis DAOM 181602=DAOM 197198]POG76869.1 hypothetical protein GLOIN_2v1768572 [Rhizophagus irregularis DAOM 181602=DAOM 197198]|eukprot:XP_025183735.1 hypothetical protein GLOIN_2v1768572 [Rhizophagus irregularis DAOM 181602=DAOM 197198]